MGEKNESQHTTVYSGMCDFKQAITFLSCAHPILRNVFFPLLTFLFRNRSISNLKCGKEKMMESQTLRVITNSRSHLMKLSHFPDGERAKSKLGNSFTKVIS